MSSGRRSAAFSPVTPSATSACSTDTTCPRTAKPAETVGVLGRARTGARALELLQADQLGPVPDHVKMVTDSAGLKASQNSYKPFGEIDTTVHNAAFEAETKGFIGERYDSDAGLQYLNARYYDPELGIFVQPDWWEVIWTGVGTNRFSYSGSGSINKSDANGNFFGSNWSSEERRARQQVQQSHYLENHEYFGRASFSSFGLDPNKSPYDNGQSLSEFRTDYFTGPGGTPKRISDDVLVRSRYNLNVRGNSIVGTIRVRCQGSSSFCSDTISAFNSINQKYGDYEIAINFILADKGDINLRASSAKISGGYYRNATRTMVLYTGKDRDAKYSINPAYYDRTAVHELGHALGLQHQRNETQSVMSYSRSRVDYFDNKEVRRLVEAYRR